MKLEVIFYDRVGTYYNGQIVEIEDSIFLRAALKGGKADVINPPDWSPDVPYEEKKEEVIKTPNTYTTATSGYLNVNPNGSSAKVTFNKITMNNGDKKNVPSKTENENKEN